MKAMHRANAAPESWSHGISGIVRFRSISWRGAAFWSADAMGWLNSYAVVNWMESSGGNRSLSFSDDGRWKR